jgi:hypothetical protein
MFAAAGQNAGEVGTLIEVLSDRSDVVDTNLVQGEAEREERSQRRGRSSSGEM